MWSYDYNYFTSGAPKRVLIGGSMPKGTYPRLGGKFLLNRKVGNRYTFRGQALWLDYMRKYAVLKKLKKSDANWILLSNRYEYLQLMDAYAGDVGGYVMHHGCPGALSENYHKLPIYFSGDFSSNAPFTHKITFEQFSKKAGNVFCVPHNTYNDREFFKDMTRAGVLAVMPMDVDAYLTDKHALGLIGNYSGLLGQVRFFKLLSNKNFVSGLTVKKKKKLASFAESLKKTIYGVGVAEKKNGSKKNKGSVSEFSEMYGKAREPHMGKYRRRAVRSSAKSLSTWVKGFVFSEEERKFHEYKLLRYHYSLGSFE